MGFAYYALELVTVYTTMLLEHFCIWRTLELRILFTYWFITIIPLINKTKIHLERIRMREGPSPLMCSSFTLLFSELCNSSSVPEQNRFWGPEQSQALPLWWTWYHKKHYLRGWNLPLQRIKELHSNTHDKRFRVSQGFAGEARKDQPMCSFIKV